MSETACKVAICKNKAMKQLEAGYQNLDDFDGEPEKFQIFASETYIKYVGKAEAAILARLNQTDK